MWLAALDRLIALVFDCLKSLVTVARRGQLNEELDSNRLTIAASAIAVYYAFMLLLIPTL